MRWIRTRRGVVRLLALLALVAAPLVFNMQPNQAAFVLTCDGHDVTVGFTVVSGGVMVNGPTTSDDTIVGTAGKDVIQGLGGDDLIIGSTGDDILCGGPGEDRILGNAGRDEIYGRRRRRRGSRFERQRREPSLCGSR